MKYFFATAVKWIQRHKLLVNIFLLLLLFCSLFMPMFGIYMSNHIYEPDYEYYKIGTYDSMIGLNYYVKSINYTSAEYDVIYLHGNMPRWAVITALSWLNFLVGIILFLFLKNKSHTFLPLIYLTQILIFSCFAIYFASLGNNIAPTGVFLLILVVILSCVYYALEKYFKIHKQVD